jgi:hypothetical protein
MKISAQFSMWGSVVFALFCLGYAFSGFSSLDGMADDAARADARGFALFWLFLGAVGIVMAIVSWRMVKGADEGSAER